MKGNEKLLVTLNQLLAEELTAINQYMVHAEMCENWGYDKLHDHFRKRSIDEMKHAEKLIARILFLEGRPVVSELRKFIIGAEVPKMFAGDHALEMGAIKAYNAATANQVGSIVPVEVTIYEDRSYTFELKTPPASQLLTKAAGIEKGSGTAGTAVVGSVTRAQVREIAELKLRDLNARDIEAAMKIIEGTARSMGIQVAEG